MDDMDDGYKRVVVNGVETDVAAECLSYEEVARLARGAGHGLLTVSWSTRDGRGGSLAPGGAPVAVEQDMVFNAFGTDGA